MCDRDEGRGSRVEGQGSRVVPRPLVLVLLACSTAPVTEPPDQPPGEVRLVEVASGLQFPVLVTAPPGDAQRLFVVEKRGVVRIIRNGALLPAFFLDLRGQVSTGGEQGLLGLAFHPQYAANGLFIVSYTNPAGHTRVSTMRVSADPDRADAASEAVFLALDQPFGNHNGGHVAFGPDGHLYVGLGDGGSAGDPGNRAQNTADLLGSMLRYAVNAQGQVSVPADNPFVGQAGARDEIWSYGLRNPWRFSFDRGTGDLYIADVGQNRREEVNVSPAAQGTGRGANYGWRIMEGTLCFQPMAGCNQQGLVLPVLDYPHPEGCSITGGYVYRGQALPALRGHYFYGDYCGGWIRSFRYSGGAAIDRREWPALHTGGQITSFGEDAAGEVYVVTAGGRILRLEPQ
jgi:glucose/arabinose dehydrogenase